MPFGARISLLLGLLALSFLGALRFGTIALSTPQVIDALRNVGDSTAITVIHELRLPRAFQAALVGAALAVSGATFQALLRNPLAEPYILGVSSGAAAGAVATVVTGWSLQYIWALPLAAFSGAIIAMLLVFRIAFSVGRSLDSRVLLLAGVVVSAFLVALIWLALTFADTESVRTAVFWMMGSHSGASWRSVGIIAATLIPSMLIVLTLARALNLLAIGEPTAAFLGASVERTKWIGFAVATLLAASSVAVAGTIGFVGLIVPHAVRLVWGGDNRSLIPCAALAGAIFLTCADTVARAITSAALDRSDELPIGIVTALVGVPFFVWLLRRPTAQVAI